MILKYKARGHMNKFLFLPTDYQAPKATNYYMKFQEGENKFRILSQPIIGWEDWQDKKPVRYKLDQKPTKPFDPKKPLKHFWSMIVWNYSLEEIQILHLTQATLRKSLEALCSDSDWGLPYFYDLKVVKSGEGMETEYMLNPLPHKPLPAHVQAMFNERRCLLDALFNNDDPFSKEHTHFTPGIFSQDDCLPVYVDEVTMEEAHNLEMILDECDPEYKIWIYGYIEKKYNTINLFELSAAVFQRLKNSANRNMQQNLQKQRNNVSEPDLFVMEG